MGGDWGIDWGIGPLETYESNFIHHNFCNSENNIRDIVPFCRLLFFHSSVEKYTTSLLQ